jgi:hypothetical protein
MSIRKLRAGRVQGTTQAEYVGVEGTIFWNESTGELRLSNGVTPGGLRVGFPIASSTELGGIKLGPGVILNQDNQVIIDSTGLDFSFGDLASTTGTYTNESDYAILQTINTNEDLVLASNGTGGIHVVGEFRINKTNGDLTDTLEAVPVFEVKSDGQVKILVPTIDSQEGAVSIVGSSTGEFISPVNTGIMLHVTGQYAVPGIPSRIYNDSQNAFAAFVARRFNGTVASPTAVLADEEIMRISGTAHDGTSIPGTGNSRIIYKALGNQTLTNHGAVIELWTTPLNSTTLAKVATINNADGITSTKFTGPLTGNVTGKADTAGNADTVTNGVYTNGSYANPAWITSLAASKVGLGSVENTALSTSTHYIGTTSIQYNRASASQTLTGVSIDGNAGTATNGVVTTGSYSDPSWLTISKSKVGLSAVENTALSTWAGSSNITTVGTLTNLAIATNGTITTPRVVINDGGLRTVSGGTTCTIDFSTDSIILWTAPTGTAVITLSNYTAGAQVKLIIALTTTRDITFGIASAALSSTGADNWNGAGAGSVDIANTAVHLEYTCITALAAGCYVKVTAN